LGIVSISGGAGVLMADAAEDYGLDVAPMPQDMQDELKSLLPFASPRNPVDVTAQFFNDLSLIPRFTRAMLDRGGYDGLIGFWTSVAGSPLLAAPLLNYLTETMSHYENRLFLHCLVAPDEIRQRYEDAGFPCFEDATRAVAAMAALMFFGEAFAAGGPGLFALPEAAKLPPGRISERAAKEILGNAGLPMVDDVLATNPKYAGEAASRMGGPVAMKIVSPDIPHKTEIGGVALGVDGAAAAEAAFARIMENAGRHAPDAKIDGVLISPMISGGVECILGAKIDAVFGPVVMFGLGGILTEVLKDVAFRRAPFGPDVARQMIDELKGAAVLKGARGQPAADLDALADAISKLSLFAAANADTLESVEMNPLRALPDRCLALDALIVKGAN
jgi:acyl-CoA synthetase (NDP forming)